MTKAVDLSNAIISPVHNPEAKILRDQAVAAAKDGRLPPTPCPHPLSAIIQWVDEEKGREGRPTNLFECRQCGRNLFLVDAHGKTAVDG